MSWCLCYSVQSDAVQPFPQSCKLRLRGLSGVRLFASWSDRGLTADLDHRDSPETVAAATACRLSSSPSFGLYLFICRVSAVLCFLWQSLLQAHCSSDSPLGVAGTSVRMPGLYLSSAPGYWGVAGREREGWWRRRGFRGVILSSRVKA